MKLDLLHVAGQNNDIAMLHYRPKRPRGVALVAGHGYSSSKHNLDFLCGFLCGHGFDVLSLDFPGHKLGAGGGVLRGVDDCIDAMEAAVTYARASGLSTIYTMGHSLGAMTALMVAARDPKIAGVVSIATGYGRPTALASLQKAGTADFRSAYVDGAALPDLVRDVDTRYDELLPRLAGRPVLYVAAAHDAMVNRASVDELYGRAPDPKTLVVIDSDHTSAGEHARREVLAWLNELHPRS